MRLAPVDFSGRTGESIALVTFALCLYAELLLYGCSLARFHDEQDFEGALHAFANRSVVSAVPSTVMTKPDGVALLKYRLISAVLIPAVIAALLLLAAGGVRHYYAGCLYAGRVGMGTVKQFRRAFTTGLAGGAVWSVIGADAILLPEYHHNIRQPRWLRCRFGHR